VKTEKFWGHNSLRSQKKFFAEGQRFLSLTGRLLVILQMMLKVRKTLPVNSGCTKRANAIQQKKMQLFWE